MDSNRKDPLGMTAQTLEEAPLIIKDLLRGLRHEIRSFDPVQRLEEIAEQNPLHPLPFSASPLAVAAEIAREALQAAKMGGALARDLIRGPNDEHLLALVDGRDVERAHYVGARHKAARRVLNRFNHSDTLLLERPIAKVWSDLGRKSKVKSELNVPDFDDLARTALALAASGALVEAKDPNLAFHVFAAIALAEAMLSYSGRRDLASTLGALDLAADVISLRKSVLDAMMMGFEPAAGLAAELRILVPHLAKA